MSESNREAMLRHAEEAERDAEELRATDPELARVRKGDALMLREMVSSLDNAVVVNKMFDAIFGTVKP